MGRVVVVGSLNVDLVTTVERHPAPGETPRGGELTRLPGGKGANQAIAAADVVLLQLEVPLATVRRAAEIAREHGVRVVLNPSPVRALPATLLDAADPLVVNAHEAASVGRTDACVTLGAAGARGGDDEITPPAVEVLDTTGAGDAFTGTLAAALAAGSGRVEALTAGVRAATTATTWPGAQDWTFETAGDLETTAGPDRGNPEARCQPPRLGFPPASRAPPPTRTARTTHMHRRVASLVCGRCTKFVVVVFWVAVVAVLGGLSTKLTDVQDNQAASWLPGSAESTKALAAQTAFSSPDMIPAIIVYERPGGVTDADMAKAAADAEAFAALDGTTAGPADTPVNIDGNVVGPIPSKDGEALQTYVPLDLGSDGWEAASPIVDDMRAAAADGADGMSTHVTGPAGSAADSAEAFAGIDSTLLLATVAVVIVILLFTYRSPILWLLPVVSAGIALTSAQGVIYLLAVHAGLTVNAQSAGILTVLVFGAGTDYALLLVARYREELRRHHDRHEAMAEALHRAGPAIIASAGTVILGMLCLVVATMNSTQGLGPVAAIGVGVGLLAMITLLPALLVIAGRWIFWPARPVEGSPEPTSSGLWSRVGTSIARRPRVVWIGTAVVLGAMSLGTLGLGATGLTSAESFRGTPDSVSGQGVVTQHFSADASSPVAIITNPGDAGAVRSAVAAIKGIAGVTEPTTRGDVSYVQGSLASAPDSQAAFDTVDQVRDAVHAVDADSLVGGTTAINADVQAASTRDNLVVIPLVLLVVFLVLAALLRAIVAPLVLIATVVLSFGAALGVSALVFQYVFGIDGADSSFPLFVFVFLVALGIDYNIFLMTRVREEAFGVGTRRGALIGLSATGGVITSAGMVLAGTFAVLASLPLTFLTQMGFAVAFGVLLDTIVVRSVLVTALNLDIGRRIWWPSRLSKAPESAPEVEHVDELVPATT